MVEKSTSTIVKADNVKFEEAMHQTGFGWYNIRMTILCGFISMAIVLETMGFSYILPASQCDLQLSLTQKGWVGAIPFIGLVSSSHIWGYLADTRGRRRVLMVSMLSGSLCSILSSFSPSLPVFAALRLASSALMSAANSVIYPYYGEFTPKKYLDTMVSVLSSIIVFSTAISTLIAWGILSMDFRLPIYFLGIDYRPWRLMVVCFAAPFLLATLAITFSKESPKFLMSQGKDEEVLEIMRSMYAVNTGDSRKNFPVNSIVIDAMDQMSLASQDVSMFQSIANQTIPLFKAPLSKHMAILCTICFGMFACSNAFFVWLPDVITRFYIGIDHIDPANNNLCKILEVRSNLRLLSMTNMTTVLPECDDSLESSTYPIMLIITCIVGVFNIILAICLRWVAKRSALLFIYGAGCLAVFAIHWSFGAFLPWLLLAIFQSVGILMGVINTVAVEIIPTHLRAMAVCLVLMFGRFGSVAGTNLCGYLIEKNCPVAFFSASGVLLVCFLTSLLLPTMTKSTVHIGQR